MRITDWQSDHRDRLNRYSWIMLAMAFINLPWVSQPFNLVAVILCLIVATYCRLKMNRFDTMMNEMIDEVNDEWGHKIDDKDDET